MANIASAGLTELWYVFEEPDGSIPANPEWKPIRYNEGGNTLAFNATRIASEENRGDRHRTADRRGTFSVAGDLTAQLCAGSLDDFFLAGFCSAAWTPRATITGTTISAAASDDSFNDSGSGFTFVPGDIVTVSGFTDPDNNGKFRVVTATTAKITVTKLDGTAANLDDEAATPSVTIAAQSQLKVGTTRRTMAVLERHTDVSVDYLYRGVEVNTVTISGVAQEKWVVTFGVLGLSQEELAALPAGSTFASPTTSDFMTALDGLFLVDGSDFGIATEFTASINNGIEQKYAVARRSAIASVISPVVAEGSVSAYFEDETFYNRLLNDTDTVLSLEATDGESGYRIIQPRAKFVEGSKQAVGTDIIVALTYSAGYDSTAGTETILERY